MNRNKYLDFVIIMKWLFIIDPIEELNYDTDSTYAIMKEVYDREMEVFFCRIQDLFYYNGATCNSKSFFLISDSFRVGADKILPLDSFDIILMRKDPPYDMKYHYATLILSLTNTLIINSPKALRDFNEKLIILPFKKYIPETFVTSNESQINSFVRSHPEGIIFKSLHSYQGRSVVMIKKDYENYKEIIMAYTSNFTSPIMIQEYIPKVRIGDKRILVLGGKPIGAVLREPLENSYLANLGQGGTPKKTTITHQEYELVNEMSNFLLKNGLYFVGLDVIGGLLTEINITCPTGIVHINKLNGVFLEKEIVDYFFNLIKNSL